MEFETWFMFLRWYLYVGFSDMFVSWLCEERNTNLLFLLWITRKILKMCGLNVIGESNQESDLDGFSSSVCFKFLNNHRVFLIMWCFNGFFSLDKRVAFSFFLNSNFGMFLFILCLNFAFLRIYLSRLMSCYCFELKYHSGYRSRIIVYHCESVCCTFLSSSLLS